MEHVSKTLGIDVACNYLWDDPHLTPQMMLVYDLPGIYKTLLFLLYKRYHVQWDTDRTGTIYATSLVHG
jgi:hypothetical protein